MSKHRLSPNPLVPAAKRLHTSGLHPLSRQHHLSFDSLYDELLLCIFSHLSAADLCVAQAINKNWQRLAVDGELWRNLYLKTYGRSRLRGSKGFTGFARADGREVRPLPVRASSNQEDLKDWKWMFRISSNWRKGRCAVDQVGDASGPPFTEQASPFRMHVLLAGDLTITASSQPSNSPTIHIFDRSRTKHSVTCESQVRDRLAEITTLAIDQSAPLLNQLRLVAFLSTGEIFVPSVRPGQLTAPTQILSYGPNPRRGGDIRVVEAVYHHPLLVSLSQDFKLSIYDLSGNTAKRTQTLSSFTSFPPTSLVLSTPTSTTYKLVIAYVIPVYPAHWTVGATELMISGLQTNLSCSHNPTSASSLFSPPSSVNPLCVISTRTTRAMDIPQGWIDVTKLHSMREQWSRKLSRVGDTQTDGKWVVLASGEEGPIRTSISSSSSQPVERTGTSQSTSSTPLQLYRLYLPPSNSIASAAPKMSFVRTLHGQTGPISSLALSDGRCVGLGLNGSLWVWDLEAGTGAEVCCESSPVGRLGEKGVVVFDDKQIVTTEGGRMIIRRFDI